jgi:aminotransferase
VTQPARLVSAKDSGAELRPLHLDLGVSSLPPPTAAREAATIAAQRPLGYSPPAGLPALRAAIAERLGTSWCRTVEPSRIVVTTGASLGLATALVLATGRWESGLTERGERGDVVLVPDPGYPAYERIAGILDLRTITYDVTAKDGGIGDIERGVSGAGSTTVIWNSPHNPTGAVASNRRTRRMMSVVESARGTVVSDEVYADFAYDRLHRSPAAVRTGAKVFTIGSFSKSFGLAGWRIGYVACPREAAVGVARVQWALAMSAPTLGQIAALAALRADPSYPDRLRADLSDRRSHSASVLSAAGLRARLPQGGFFLWATPPAGLGDGDEFAHLAWKRARVGLQPGSTFGNRGRPFVRVSFAGDPDEFDEAADRLRRLVGQNMSGAELSRLTAAPRGQGLATDALPL